MEPVDQEDIMNVGHVEGPATLTVEQAGQLLGISRRAAYRGVEAGHIPFIRLGRRILVPTAKLYAMLGLAPMAAVEVVARDADRDRTGF